MMKFHIPTLEDKQQVDAIFHETGYRGCDFTFANLYLWKEVYHYEIAYVKECLCVRSNTPATGLVYYFPVGKKNQREVFEQLRSQKERTAVFGMILEEHKEQIEQWYPGEFVFDTKEASWDYVYLTQELRELKGKKFHGKRNHIARLKEGGRWSYEAITSENILQCREMNEAWFQEYIQKKGPLELKEREVLRQCFQDFFALGLTGGLLKKEEKIVAYTIGEPLTEDTYVVHFEKAFGEVQGAYPLINQQFVEHAMGEYTYVNREEDMGELGLRKAKESYYPQERIKKYTAAERGMG